LPTVRCQLSTKEMASEHVTVKLPQLPAWPGGEEVRPDDMLYVWDSEKGRLCHAPVAALPFGSGTGTGGGGASTVLASPFMVGRGDPRVSVQDGTTTVSDARLLGKADYPVTSTQLNNAAFRPGEITYDPQAGTASLPGFDLLGGEYLVLYPAGTQQAGGALQPLWDRIAALEAMLAPFAPSATGPAAGRVWWTGPPESVPAGWAEDTDMRNLYPLHRSSAGDAKSIGDMVGNSGHRTRLKSDQQGSVNFRVMRANRKGNGPVCLQGVAFAPGGTNDWTESYAWEPGGDQQWGPTRSFRPGDGLATIDLRPRSRVGMWIKYVGA